MRKNRWVMNLNELNQVFYYLVYKVNFMYTHYFVYFTKYSILLLVTPRIDIKTLLHTLKSAIL